MNERRNLSVSAEEENLQGKRKFRMVQRVQERYFEAVRKGGRRRRGRVGGGGGGELPWLLYRIPYTVHRRRAARSRSFVYIRFNRNNKYG